jgi:hypothetical protein
MSDNEGIRKKVQAYGHFDRDISATASDEMLARRFRERESIKGEPITPVSLVEMPQHVQEHASRFAHLLDIEAEQTMGSES